jgi:hypothetical protein
MTDNRNHAYFDLKADLARVGNVLKDLQQMVLAVRETKQRQLAEGDCEGAEFSDAMIVRHMNTYAKYRTQELDIQCRILAVGGKVS